MTQDAEYVATPETLEDILANLGLGWNLVYLTPGVYHCPIDMRLNDGHAFVPEDTSDHGWPSYTCAVCGKRKAEHSDGEADG